MRRRVLFAALLGLCVMAPVTGGGPGGTPQTDCDSALNDKVLYDTATGLWSCGVDQGGGSAFGFGTIGNAVADVGGDTLTVTDSSSIDFTTTDGPENITAAVLFEGATPDTFETSVFATDPTADRVFTLPNADSVAVQPFAVVASQFLTGISTLGVVTAAQVASTDLYDGADVLIYSVVDATDLNGLVDIADISTATRGIDNDSDYNLEGKCTPNLGSASTCSFDPDESGVNDVYFSATAFNVGGTAPNIAIVPAARGQSTFPQGDLEASDGVRIGKPTTGATGIGIGSSVCIGRSPLADKLFEDTDCDFRIGTNLEPETTPSTTSNAETFASDMQRRLSADFTTATTAATPCTSALCQVANLKLDLDWIGAYWIEFQLLTQSTVLTTGMSFGVEYTGTETILYCVRNYPSTGAGVGGTTGVVDDVAATNTGQHVEHMAANVATTLVPNLGPTAGVATVDSTALETITCNLLTTTAGDLQLWVAAETADTVRVMANSMVKATPFP